MSKNPKQLKLDHLFFKIQPPHDKNIQQSILRNLAPMAGDDTFSEDFLRIFGSSDQLTDPLEETCSAYYSSLESDLFDGPLDPNLFKKPVVYTAVHGVGADYIDRAVKVAGFAPLVHVKEQRGISCQSTWISYTMKSRYYDIEKYEM